jgi:hypothetical protein
MKTAMQELIEWLDIAIEELKGNDSTDFAEGLVAARVKANKALEKEKEQIIADFEAGYKSCDLDEAFEINRKLASGEEYYNQTYNL